MSVAFDDQVIRTPWGPLERWTADMLRTVGIESEDAALASRILVRTDARGFHTHGLTRLKSYLEKLRTGEIAPRGALVTRVKGVVCDINAAGTLGQIAGPKAVDIAINLANDAPVVVCQLQDAGHLGALGLHVLRAAESGLVALMFQATPPVMGMAGARKPLIGNNPLAMAAPRPNGPPIVVDMACCVAARGNVLNAARNRRQIPEGWALNNAGMPTTDAEAALGGMLLPFGLHKGMGLAMIVEILAGSLAGVTFQNSMGDGTGGVRSGTGHMNALIIVLNPRLMQGQDSYDAHVAAWTDHFVDEGGLGARIPGHRAHDEELQSKQLGVPLLKSIVRELIMEGATAGIPFPTHGADHASASLQS